jgi:hypothetical protein
MRKRILYYDESSLLLDSFFSFLESHSSDLFLVDESIHKRIKFLEQNGRYLESYTLLSALEMGINLNIIELVKSNAGFDFKFIETWLNETKEFHIVSQNENLFTRIPSTYVKNKKITLSRLEGVNLVPFTLVEETKLTYNKAFYLEQDSFMKMIEVEKVKTVYSPVFGYLPLDKNSPLAGGEGILFNTIQGLMIKIYNEKNLLYTNVKKLQLMKNFDIYNPSIVWPLDLVYVKGHFAGYVMKKVENASSLTVLIEQGGNAKFKLNPYNRLQVFKTILENIQYLHQKNILVGDLKDENILVTDANQIYLVDSGSFQIQDYASNVLTKGWVDQKANSKFNAKKNLRKIEDEFYPIFRIGFELLIGKNPHYNPKNPELDLDRTTDFYFPKVPLQATEKSFNYEKLWYLYTQGIRDLFCNFFSNPDLRQIPSIDEILNEIEVCKVKFRPNS